MKNELQKKTDGNILYEPIEPLFNGLPRRRGMWAIRVAALLVLSAVVACVWVIVASGKNDTGGGGNYFDIGGQTQENENYTETESVAESEEGEDLEESGDEGESETENDIIQTPSSLIEVDLSEIEKGLGYVINYSGKSADITGLMDRGFLGGDTRNDGAPIVLVLHTHTSEEYQSGGSEYRGPVGVVSVGDILVSRLNSLGVGAVHCSVIHDEKGGNAYRNAEKTVKMMREIYPSLRYVIDIHRMELYEGDSLVKTVSGCADGSAQIRLSVGADDIGNRWQEELSLALELRKNLNRNGARVCMPIVITPGISSFEMGEFYIMADVGTLGNTVEEAMAAGERLACALADVLVK